VILKGNQRAGGDDLASHLMNLYDNDAVELAQTRGTVAQDLHGAFAEFEAMASGTRAREALYSLSINPSEPMSREQYFTAIDRIEDRLGLSGQARAVVFHVKGGREHCHVVWSRIDSDQMKAVQLSHDRQKLRAIARELGQEFGHDLPHGLRNDRGGERFGANGMTTAAELAQADRSGLTADERRKEITSAYREATGAQSFIDGLWQRGYHLAKGDKRGFVVVDRSGQVHSLSRQIIGANTKDLRAMLAPLNPEELPSVKETRKRIADQMESDALDENQKPHLRRVPEELKARQAERRAALEALWQKAELAQRDERIQLHAAQKRERDRPFARAAMTVFGLLGRVPVLRSVLGPLYKNPSLNIEERHRLENEALDRRYQRERKTLDRRLSALGRVEARENKSLARDQRRLDADLKQERGRAADAFGKAASDRGKSEGQGATPESKQGPRKSRPRGYRFEP
jgi:relaxase-like protein